MSKKLKKKMEELCGLIGLNWEERQEKAEQILQSNTWKQDLCNQLQGLSFRDLEAYLRGVASERQKKEEGYERKLAAYNAKDSKSLRENSARRTKTEPMAPPRTIQEILKQVYAPRVQFAGLSAEERERIGCPAKKERSNIPQNADNVDDRPEE